MDKVVEMQRLMASNPMIAVLTQHYIERMQRLANDEGFLKWLDENLAPTSEREEGDEERAD
jgi:hypothetical protein